jgi:hypothetical protein
MNGNSGVGMPHTDGSTEASLNGGNAAIRRSSLMGIISSDVTSEDSDLVIRHFTFCTVALQLPRRKRVKLSL